MYYQNKKGRNHDIDNVIDQKKETNKQVLVKRGLLLFIIFL